MFFPLFVVLIVLTCLAMIGWIVLVILNRKKKRQKIGFYMIASFLYCISYLPSFVRNFYLFNCNKLDEITLICSISAMTLQVTALCYFIVTYFVFKKLLKIEEDEVEV